MKEISFCWAEKLNIDRPIPIYWELVDADDKNIIGFIGSNSAGPFSIPCRTCRELPIEGDLNFNQIVPLRTEDVTPIEESVVTGGNHKRHRKMALPSPDDYQYYIRHLYKYKGYIFNYEKIEDIKNFSCTVCYLDPNTHNTDSVGKFCLLLHKRIYHESSLFAKAKIE